LVSGLVRGAVVIAAVVMLAQFVRLDQAQWWKKSRLLPYAQEYAGWIQSFAETGMKLLDAQSQSFRQLPTPSPRV
jgi:uncharacterized membrane protein required for colicin V production